MSQLTIELDRLVSTTEAVHAEALRLRDQLVGGAHPRGAPSERDLQRIEEQVIYLRLLLDTVRETSRKLRLRPDRRRGAGSPASASRAA